MRTRCLRAFGENPIVAVDRLDRSGPVDGPVQKPHNLRTRCGVGPVGPPGPVKIEGVRSEIDEIMRRGAHYMAIVVIKCYGFFCPLRVVFCSSARRALQKTSAQNSTKLHFRALEDLGKLSGVGKLMVPISLTG